jgi:hypothetical protein
MRRSFRHLLIFTCAGVLLSQAAAEAPPSVGPEAQPGTERQTEAKRKALMAEATNAIRETENALKALDEGKSAPALAALERATGKLETILAREPRLALAASDVNVVTYDVQGGIEAVKKARDRAEELMDEGRLQEARRLMKNLASETVISVTNIPLATYPAAIKEAVRLIDQQKTDEAKRVLQTALNTLVITETVVPLPVVSAEASLKEAETLAEKKDRTSDDSRRLSKSLTEARKQLEFAAALGYGTKSDFDKMYTQLGEIEQKTSGNKSGAGFFAKIKSSISDMLERYRTTIG